MEKKMKRSLTILVLAAASCMVFGTLNAQTASPASKPASLPAASVPAGGTRVAVCDVATVFRSYQRLKDLSLAFKQKQDLLRVEDEKRGKEIEGLQKTLESLARGSKEYQNRLAELDKANIDRAAWLQYQSQLLKREHLRLTGDMYRDVLKSVNDIASELGYDLVISRDSAEITSESIEELMDKMMNRKCLFFNPASDITDAVIERVNRNYKKE